MRSPSPSARKRWVRKFIEKTRMTALATLASTPRREYPIPSGAAIQTTTKQVHGSARRYCKCVRNGASRVTGKSELKWRYWRSSGKLRYLVRTRRGDKIFLGHLGMRAK